jgi:hypothetical protein
MHGIPRVNAVRPEKQVFEKAQHAAALPDWSPRPKRAFFVQESTIARFTSLFQ